MGIRTVKGEELLAPGMTDEEPGAPQGMADWAEAPPAPPSKARRETLIFMTMKNSYLLCCFALKEETIKIVSSE